MQSRRVAGPGVRRIALFVASVPLETKRSISICGMMLPHELAKLEPELGRRIDAPSVLHRCGNGVEHARRGLPER